MAEQSVELRGLTALKVGGTPLRYYRPSDERELRLALAECRRHGLGWRVLGGGSNLLVDEGPLPFAVIHVHEPGLGGIRREGGRLLVGAGTPTASLLAFCRTEGLGGLEFLAGLPGTVGGALAGNAGAWGRSIGDVVRRVRLLYADGDARWLRATELGFGYRRSAVEASVITRAELALEPRDPALIARQMVACARRRRQSGHPMGQCSAGCMFRNPPGASAGRLLDICGLKGLRIGGAQVSERHANFVVNSGNATAREILELIERMKETVRRRFGIELELEVRHWPSRPRVA